MTNQIILDSGPLINLSMNCLLNILPKMKQKLNIEFLITKEVKYEIIDHPSKINRFKLGALRLKYLFDKKIINHAKLNNQEINQLRETRNRITQIANTTFKTRNKHLHILDKGESAALALSIILKEKTKKNIPIIIDERTTRMLCENPENLRELLSKKFHTTIKANTSNYNEFKDFKIIRSTELAYIAYKKGFINSKDPEILEAILYGLKFKGCSISEEEIKEIIKL